MEKIPVGPSRSGQRRMPCVAQHELGCELIERGALRSGVDAAHDIARVADLRWGAFGTGGRVVCDEAGIVDLRIGLAFLQLYTLAA